MIHVIVLISWPLFGVPYVPRHNPVKAIGTLLMIRATDLQYARQYVL
jgi:hypothetical protein